MVEIPENDAGERCFFLQAVDAELHPLRFQPVRTRGFQNIGHFSSIPAHTAVNAELLQRDLFAVIGKDHSKAGSAAFDVFHLHDLGDYCDPVFHLQAP